ncbi:MAG TPA: hypothetical protein VLJ17_02420 [Xanthobacteraceae bacterium]|nr:hypothetical protein [Xanthobacteraceae bacterium]
MPNVARLNASMCRFGFLIAAAVLAGAPGVLLAQRTDERPVRREVWDIQLGAKVADLPDDFVDYACGTNGGPPSTPLTGWKDYRRCRGDVNGLREVYFRYDDELEYWAKANNLTAQMEQYVGTKTYGFPINVSVLIGDDVVRGIRIVSDPRDPTGDREEAYLLRNFLSARFGREGWLCEDLAAEPGETPVTGIFIKQRCQKDMEGGVHGLMVTRHLRKPGQSQFDPQSGKETTNQFESNVRFELTKMK